MNLGELIAKLHRNILFELKQVAKLYNLTMSQFLCIISIPYEGISQTHLANKLSVDISTLSRNLDKLYKKKILKKVIDYPDKRVTKIFLTVEGNTLNIELLNHLNNNLSYLINDNTIHQILIDQLSELNWQLLQHQSNEGI